MRDEVVPLPHPRLVFDAAGSRDKSYARIEGASHYYAGQPEQLAETGADLLLLPAAERPNDFYVLGNNPAAIFRLSFDAVGPAVLTTKRIDLGVPARIGALRDRLWDHLRALPGVHLNGGEAPRLAGHLNVAFEGVDGEMLLTALTGAAVSTGSACTSASLEPSYVLKAMGLSDELAQSALRFSVGRFTDEAGIDRAGEDVVGVVTRLRDAARSRA